MSSAATIGRVSALPANLIAQAIPRLSRHELEAVTERLIDRLDEIDGDPDAEDDLEDCCPSHDDGCGPVMVHGFACWGSEHDDQGI